MLYPLFFVVWEISRNFPYNKKHFVRYCTARREENSLTALLARGTKVVQIRLLKRESAQSTLLFLYGKFYAKWSK